MKYITLLLVVILISSCDLSNDTEVKPKDVNQYKAGVIYDAIVKNNILGDFDGNGIKEELKETLYSSITKTSIDALPRIGYDSIVDFVYDLKPILSLKSTNKKIPNLELTKKTSFGLFFIKNEGDLNGDGTDEISVVIDWADWSQCNSCFIYSLQKNRWVKLGQFEVREWQLERNNNFNGFIVKNKAGEFEALTFDAEMIEINQPLNELLITPSKQKRITR